MQAQGTDKVKSSTNNKSSSLGCPERDSNPHALKDTWPSTMPVYQFQHPGIGYLHWARKFTNISHYSNGSSGKFF